MKNCLLVFALISLSACSPITQFTDQDCLNRMVYKNGEIIEEKCDDDKKIRKYSSKENFSIEMPGDLFVFTEQEPVAFSCGQEKCMIDLQIHSQKNGSCSPTLTGSWQMEPMSISGTESLWGKVDFFERYAGTEPGGWIDYDGGERPVCAEPATANARYAFCAEKDGKTVVICINQMTDNPEQAKEIFETFRWTE